MAYIDDLRSIRSQFTNAILTGTLPIAVNYSLDGESYDYKGSLQGAMDFIKNLDEMINAQSTIFLPDYVRPSTGFG